MKTTLSSKGQVVLPAELRKRDQIRPGQQFEVERVQSGQYLLKKVSGSGPAGMLDWLRTCPEKGWFQAIPSETTDEL